MSASSPAPSARTRRPTPRSSASPASGSGSSRRRARRRSCSATATPRCSTRSRCSPRRSSASRSRSPSRTDGGARGRGAVRQRPEGLVRDAAQAQPDRLRADLRARPRRPRRAVRARERRALARAGHLHSSAERVVLPDAFLAVDYMLDRFAWLVEGLVVRPERMRENLDASHGLYFSQRLLLALVEAGLLRDEAYRLVQRTRCAPGTRASTSRSSSAPTRRSPDASTSTRSSTSAPTPPRRRRLRAARALREEHVHA